ncbi:hypothetical protein YASMINEVIRUS_1334 [Yasminevirus sp. GU-2018]|uniref:Uncharacterized protein n=1 Tax=Yasminevirus sp. GU-2018 TaxID=2420051 RepID=A0A5K0UB39_9VIRU|nr:hypothetical protein YASMINEVIRUS_1334 [Yasminevirus sp. GU-2018]
MPSMRDIFRFIFKLLFGVFLISVIVVHHSTFIRDVIRYDFDKVRSDISSRVVPSGSIYTKIVDYPSHTPIHLEHQNDVERISTDVIRAKTETDLSAKEHLWASVLTDTPSDTLKKGHISKTQTEKMPRFKTQYIEYIDDLDNLDNLDDNDYADDGIDGDGDDVDNVVELFDSDDQGDNNGDDSVYQYDDKEDDYLGVPQDKSKLAKDRTPLAPYANPYKEIIDLVYEDPQDVGSTTETVPEYNLKHNSKEDLKHNAKLGNLLDKPDDDYINDIINRIDSLNKRLENLDDEVLGEVDSSNSDDGVNDVQKQNIEHDDKIDFSDLIEELADRTATHVVSKDESFWNYVLRAFQ